ncbi:MAG: Fur family transcriptional regulator [Candidatus Ornithospirochaeta sp.]
MKYDTHSRKEILSFLEKNSQLSFSMEDICSSLGDVKKSTVYRIVDSLEKEGKVRRTGNSGRRTQYQYSGSFCTTHMHIKCRVCGKTEHLDYVTTERIKKEVDDLLGFETLTTTVLDGLCGECRKNKELN